jgi:hypothetical protein
MRKSIEEHLKKWPNSVIGSDGKYLPTVYKSHFNDIEIFTAKSEHYCPRLIKNPIRLDFPREGMSHRFIRINVIAETIEDAIMSCEDDRMEEVYPSNWKEVEYKAKENLKIFIFYVRKKSNEEVGLERLRNICD